MYEKNKEETFPLTKEMYPHEGCILTLSKAAMAKWGPTVSLTRFTTSSEPWVASDIRDPSRGDPGTIWSSRNRRAASDSTLRLWKAATTPATVRLWSRSVFRAVKRGSCLGTSLARTPYLHLLGREGATTRPVYVGNLLSSLRR
jgi:hypothetical protein